MQTFFIPGPLPGMNEITLANRGTKGGWRTGSSQKKKWQKIIVAECKVQKLYRVETIADIHFDWVEKGRRRDKDNICAGAKFILDGMVGAGVLVNDNWKYVADLTHTFRVDKENPGVYVTVKER